jgi:MFS-type transporter involved in bile tolerance (Atg22 family)
MGDYGHWKKWILITSTLTCWAMQFGFLGLKDPSQYQSAIGLYVVSTLSYNICQAFWTPSFPQLARNTPEALASKQSFLNGELTETEFESVQMLQRNRLSNIAFGCMSIGYTTTLLIALGAAYGLHANESSAGNNKAAVVIIGVATGVWIICGTPWFFLEKPRAAALPKGETYFSVGAKAYWNAFKRIPRLTQTWLYLLGYFLISDGYATTNQIYGICQNAIVSYSTTTSTELYIVQGLSNAFGIMVFWLIQRRYKVRTKLILMINCGFLLVIPIWGCIGIGTDKFGFHNVWEVWAFSVIDCAAVAPFYAFAATMLSDICPKGREVTFFAIYALVSKSTAWIGPIVSGIIIDRTGNTWKGFPFSLGLTVAGYICISFVDVEKGKEQCERYVLEDPTLQKKE